MSLQQEGLSGFLRFSLLKHDQLHKCVHSQAQMIQFDTREKNYIIPVKSYPQRLQDTIGFISTPLFPIFSRYFLENKTPKIINLFILFIFFKRRILFLFLPFYLGTPDSRQKSQNEDGYSNNYKFVRYPSIKSFTQIILDNPYKFVQNSR